MAKAPKQRTNVSLDVETLSAARELGLNISAISNVALEQAVRSARQKAWHQQNADAIEERKNWLSKNGLPLAEVQLLKTGE